LPLTPRWLDDRLMEWTMADSAVKVQLFRFIDVLPLLRSCQEVNRHLREYFTQASPHLPGWMRFGFRHLPADSFAGGILAKTARWNAERLARRFIAGTNLGEVVGAIAAMRRRSLAFTVDLLGEATITEAEAERYQAEYLHLIEGISRHVNTWPEQGLI